MTTFQEIYDVFFSQITDDMFMELTPEDTLPMCEELMKNALPWFEFPRVNVYDFSVELQEYNIDLSLEEINIIAIYMVAEWLGQQLATTENTRLKYSGSDFKFTSQANHMAKIKVLKDNFIADGFHMQRLYKRRKRTEDGKIQSTLGQIMEVPSYGFKV